VTQRHFLGGERDGVNTKLVEDADEVRVGDELRIVR
jgi:hypothetical protein